MRFLITGGAGFIGVALANWLAQAGHDVRVLDDLSAGDPSKLHPEVLFSRGDVRDRPKLWTLLQDVDCVYHLAARVSVEESVLYPRDYNDVNVGGTVSLCEALRDAGARRLVFTSSATVYGPQVVQPVNEASWPHPSVPYAVSKLAAEHYISALGELYNIETVILRIFNAYGPDQRVPPAHAPVLPLFAKNALNGASLVVNGDGRQTRDFVYIDDVLDALVAAAQAPNINRAAINIGSGQETSIQQLIYTLGEVLGQQPDVIYNQRQQGGLPRLVADIHQAQALLGFEPRVPLIQGIERLLTGDPRFAAKFANLRGTRAPAR